MLNNLLTIKKIYISKDTHRHHTHGC